MPRFSGYVRIDADDFLGGAVPHQQKQSSVSESIDLDEVIVFRRYHSQCEAADFIRAGKGLETKRDIAVLQRGRSTNCQCFRLFGRGGTGMFEGCAGRGRSVGNDGPGERGFRACCTIGLWNFDAARSDFRSRLLVLRMGDERRVEERGHHHSNKPR